VALQNRDRPHYLVVNGDEGEPGTSVTAVGALRGLLGVPGVEENVGMVGIHHRGR
jgi:tocopherol cyclase